MNHRHRPAPPAPPPMTRRRPSPFAAVLGLALAALLIANAALDVQPLALGQRAAGGLPADLKQAGNPGARQDEIEKFVSAQVAKLQKGKAPADRQEARNVLVRETTMVGGQPNAAFLNVYASVLNKQLLPVAKNSDAHARLNAAIALQGVAERANNGALAEAATVMAADPGAGVVLWAAKGAQSILPSLAAAGENTRLTGAIVAAVKKHPDSPDLAEDAYRALTLDFPRNLKLLNAKAVPVLLPDVLKLFEFRVARYVKQTPAAPWLDEIGANFLTFGVVWNHPAAAKRHPAIMQQLSNLIGVAAQHAAARGPNDNKEFIDLIRRTGPALAVVGGHLKDPDIQAAAKALQDVRAADEAEALAELAEQAHAAIKAKFPIVKPAPTIDDGAAVDLVDDEAPLQAGPSDDEAAETSAKRAGEDEAGARTAAARTERKSGKGKAAAEADADAEAGEDAEEE